MSSGERRKIATVYSSFSREIDAILRLDGQNQRRYRPGPGRPAEGALSKPQMLLMTEGLFMRAFSHYEQFLEEVFILYTRQKKTISGRSVPGYILPITYAHAREMLKSNMNFLEWNSPDNVIQRCETYLKKGDPIKAAITSNITKLKYMRKIRNAIAHKSVEAFTSFEGVVRSELRAAPLKPLAPGEFLLHSDPATPPSYFLVSYLSVLKSVAAMAVA